ncbi:diguanylate cyclase [Sulfurospirillum sp. 1307]
MKENIPVFDLESYVKLLHETANVVILMLDKKANILYVNSYIEDLTGYKREELIGKNWIEIFIPSLYDEEIDNVFHDVIENKNMHWGNENEIVCKDNSLKMFSWNNSLYFDRDGNFEVVLSVGKDITQFKEAEKNLKNTIEDLKLEHKSREFLFNRFNNILIETDGENMINANKQLLEFFGYDSLDKFKEDTKCICYRFIEHNDYFHLGLVPKEDNWIDVLKKLPKIKQTVVMLNKDYESRVFKVRFSSYTDKKFLIYFDDVTELMEEAKKYEYKAYHDNLTGIYNREKFNLIFNNLKEKVSFIMFDIDHFKKVNDTYGHDIGDKVLKELCKCVSKELRSRDIFVRWGGEEFIIMIPFLGEKKAFNIAQRIRMRVEKLDIKGLPKITISLGVTNLLDKKDKDDAIKRVDKALYEAKESGRNRVVEL